MKWKKLCGICLFALLACWLVSTLAVSAQDVTVKMTKEEAVQYRIGKIQQELNQINADLRKKNPTEFKRIDDLVAEAQKIQQELQPQPQPQAPAKKK